jgi:hypothetical protein
MPFILNLKCNSNPRQVYRTETRFTFSQPTAPFGIFSLYSNLNALKISNKCFINSPAGKKAKIYCQALDVLRESNSRISVRDY